VPAHHRHSIFAPCLDNTGCRIVSGPYRNHYACRACLQKTCKQRVSILSLYHFHPFCFSSPEVWIIYISNLFPLAEIRHINYSHVRSNENNSKFFFTKDWTRKYYDENDNETCLPLYNVKDNKDFTTWDAFDAQNKTGRQLYYYKSYRPNLDTYPLPDYIGAIPFIEIDFEIANYWYNAVKNGFTASHIITFYGDPGTQEEQKNLEERITKKFTGTDKAGKIILNFSQNKERGGSEIANIAPLDLDKQFQILNETVQQEIFSGHRITSPMLFGIKSPGQLGGRTELIESHELFQNVFVTPKQKKFENVFTRLLHNFGMNEKVELQKIAPIGLDIINSSNAWSLLTTPEKRKAMGLQP